MDQDYRAYFEAMPCYLSVQNRELQVIAANERFRRDLGEWEGRRCFQVYKGRSEKCEVCPVEQTFEDGQCHTNQECVIAIDGKETPVIVYTSPVLDEGGKVVAVEKVSTDITQIAHLQRQLRESQARYRQLFEEVPCYISIQDPNLKIVEANRRFREDFGNCLGCYCYKGYKHRDEECVACPVQETFKDGQVHRSEEVVTSRAGTPMNVLVYAAPIKDENGHITHVMEMSTNITPIRELQTQLESIGLLISSISHGIKGLLTGLDGGIYLVNSGLAKENTSRVKEGWEMVERNVDRIRNTVLNILYYAKERAPIIDTVSAKKLVAEICEVMTPKAGQQGVPLRCSLQPGAAEFEGDQKALRAMLVNLIENALDACRVDKRKADHEVTLAVKSEPSHVVFEVEDNGIGMDQETRERAFSLFFSSKGVEGTGLGLFIAHKIARAHQGAIEIDSKLGRGTRFSVRIPRKRPMSNRNESEK